MSNPTSLSNAEIMTLRLELFVAEKRVSDIHAQLEKAGDHAFLASHANGQPIAEVPDCL